MNACYQKTYPVELPPGAGFFHRGRNIHVAWDFGPEILRNLPWNTDRVSESWVIVGDEASRRYLLFGAVTARRSLTNFIVHTEHARVTGVTAYQPEIRRDESPEEIVVLEGADWRDLLVEYAETTRQRAGAPPQPAAVNSVGYCSWYYFYHQLSEVQFMESVRALVSRRDVFPARVAQIDDGYQPAHGDWLGRNEQWPTPFPETTRRLNDLGLAAGIWTMPLLADTASEVFRAHPDWFVRDRHGAPWLLHGWSPPPHHLWACLDFSRADVQAHLRRVFETLYGWGFRYFKLDGWFTATNGVRHEPGATGISCVRTVLQIIRAAVRDSIVVGCGVPFLPSIGLVDHSRVSGDTGMKWRATGLPAESGAPVDKSQPFMPGMPCLEAALQASLSNWWQYDRWFRADPDCLMARDEHTELTVGEARLSVLSGIVTGVAITSDRLDRMSAERLRLLGLAANIRLRQARPVDWKDRLWPHVFAGTVEGKKAVAIFNYSELPQTWTLAALGLGGPVEERLHPLGRIEQRIELPGHDAALLLESRA